MENKINIAKLLKDCPSGMELDCTMYEDMYFDYVDNYDAIHCYIQFEGYKTSITFNQYGTYNSNLKSKCVIFPKGETTWEGFQRPFKDGDVISVIINQYLWYGIYQEEFNDILYCYVSYSTATKSIYTHLSSQNNVCSINHISEIRVATKEEKQKLFDAIEKNGYKWNAETKKLEKLPRFKVGDRVKSIFNNCQYIITKLTNTHYTLVEVINKFQYTELIIEDKNWELVSNKFDITTLKPFDKVLVRDRENQVWVADLFSHIVNRQSGEYLFACAGHYAKQCIPYKGNEHLSGTDNDCGDFYKTWE